MKVGAHTCNLSNQEAKVGGSWTHNSMEEKLPNIPEVLGSILNMGVGEVPMNYMNEITKIYIPMCSLDKRFH